MTLLALSQRHERICGATHCIAAKHICSTAPVHSTPGCGAVGCGCDCDDGDCGDCDCDCGDVGPTGGFVGACVNGELVLGAPELVLTSVFCPEFVGGGACVGTNGFGDTVAILVPHEKSHLNVMLEKNGGLAPNPGPFSFKLVVVRSEFK